MCGNFFDSYRLSVSAKLHSVRAAIRQLKLILAAFFVALLFPAYVLFSHLYHTLTTENINKQRSIIQQAGREVNIVLTKITSKEDARAFIDYSYDSLVGRNNNDGEIWRITPLADLDSNNTIPGLVGYFQISQDGSLLSPLLPDIGQTSDNSTQLPEDVSEMVHKQQLIKETLTEKRLDLWHAMSKNAPAATETRTEKMYVKPAAKLVYTDPFSLNLEKYLQGPELEEEPPQRIDILIGRLQAAKLDHSYIVFYRPINLQQERIVQGFVVHKEALLRTITNSTLKQYPALHSFKLEFRYKNISELELSNALPTNGSDRHIVEQISLVHPMSDWLMVITAFSGSSTMLHQFTIQIIVLFVVVLLAGIILVYIVGMNQINLAQRQSDFVSAITHELKTPITTMRMYNEMLFEGLFKEEKQAEMYRRHVLQESDRISHLINNLLQFTKLARGKTSLPLADHTPDELLNAALELARSRVELRGFSLNVSSEMENCEEVLTVSANKEAFNLVILNLIDNAIKFSGDTAGKTIDVGYRLCDEQGQFDLEFFVRDYGPGIPTSEGRKIFEPFYRCEDELTRSSSGTGIGLTLALDAAERMGAALSFINLAPGVAFLLRFSSSTTSN